MQIPGLPSLLFLAYLVVFLPWGAWRTARRLRGEVGAPVSRVAYWRSAVVDQAFLLVIAWLAGSTFDYEVFAFPHLTRRDAGWALAALLLCFGLRQISRWTRSEDELKRLAVYQRSPRTREELVWFNIAVLAASVAEEAAYRGVGWSILWYSLGNPWLAALIMCAAFALAHWSQGWKSGITIFGFAAILHGLVAVTETLVLAMVVHAAYDFIAGYLIRRRARLYDQNEHGLLRGNNQIPLD